MAELKRKTAGFTLLLAVSVTSTSYAIDVRVNGQPVEFIGAQPMQIEGRVFVPLRGVLEKMGAEFVWDQPTKTILGTRGDRRFELPIGSHTASLNGNVTTLDVPAQVVRGNTMVPLRFVSEALGADIKWNGSTQTVEISTDEFFPGSPAPSAPGNSPATPAPPPTRSGRSGIMPATPAPSTPLPPTRANRGKSTTVPATGVPNINTTDSGEDPVIDSFRHLGSAPVKAGGFIETELEGTPGASAYFDVVGVATHVPMKEATPGHYTGRVAAPNGISVKNARVFARLTKQNRTSNVVQAGDSITVDAQPPQILNLNPANGAVVSRARPDIYAEYRANGESGIDPATVRLIVNGKDVTDNARVTPGFVIYTPAENLNGPVQIQVRVADHAGNVTSAASSFTAKPTAEGLSAATHNGVKPLTPGQSLTVTAKGEPAGKATFTLPGIAENVPMAETSPGAYSGTYTVKASDQAFSIPVKVRLNAGGKVSQLDTAQPVSLTGGELHPPSLIEPKPGTKLEDQITVTGRADPGSTVRISLTTTGKLFGLLPLGGSEIVQEAHAGADGTFKSEAITLPKPLGAKNLQYRLQLVTVDPTGKTSDPMEQTYGAK